MSGAPEKPHIGCSGRSVNTLRDNLPRPVSASVRRAGSASEDTSPDEWLRTYERELDNLRAALEWSLDHHDVELGIEVSGVLSHLHRRLESANLLL